MGNWPPFVENDFDTLAPYPVGYRISEMRRLNSIRSSKLKTHGAYKIQYKHGLRSSCENMLTFLNLYMEEIH